MKRGSQAAPKEARVASTRARLGRRGGALKAGSSKPATPHLNNVMARLSIAVVEQALKDVARDNGHRADAVRWLKDPEAERILLELGFTRAGARALLKEAIAETEFDTVIDAAITEAEANTEPGIEFESTEEMFRYMRA